MGSDCFDPPINKPGHSRHDDHQYGYVKRPQGRAEAFPVLAQEESTVGQPKAPRKRPDKSENAKLPEVHAGYSGRDPDESTDHRQQPGKEDYPIAILVKLGLGPVDLFSSNQYIFTIL